MTTLTFFPLGSADSILIQNVDEKLILFDYANMRDSSDKSDKRADLPTLLRQRLIHAGKDGFDVVAFTHLDEDHIKGSSEFFYFEWAKKYQSDDRKRIDELWVPAAAIIEKGLDGEKGVIRAEAQYRLEKGEGIKVFSRPDALKDWLESKGLSIKDRESCIVDAGQLVPGFKQEDDGLEFFVHSPYAIREEDGDLLDRNRDSIVVHVTFNVNGQLTKAFLASDIDHEALEKIVKISKHHGNEERLEWDIYKLPHHCSYLGLGPDKGTEQTKPTETVKEFVEEYAQRRAIIVSTSDPIPETSTDGENPPHKPAANYYKSAKKTFEGEFMVTMETPSKTTPKPIEIGVSENGATVIKNAAPVAPIISKPAPRAG